MPMPDSPLRAEARQALQAGWTAPQIGALDAISRAVRELTGSLAGFQDASVALAVREPAPSRCWRCEIAGESAVPAGPGESGLRVDLCDACLAHLADPDASSARAIAEHDQIARRQLKDQEEDRATAERSARFHGLGRVDEDA